VKYWGSYGKELSKTLYEQTTGLRTVEWAAYTGSGILDISFPISKRPKRDIEYLVDTEN
jgi:hypothetical protein